MVQHHAPATLYPGKDPVPIVQEAGWATGPVWTGVENLAPTGTRSPDHPACGQSLYWLRYLAHKFNIRVIKEGLLLDKVAPGSSSSACISVFPSHVPLHKCLIFVYHQEVVWKAHVRHTLRDSVSPHSYNLKVCYSNVDLYKCTLPRHYIRTSACNKNAWYIN